MTDDDRIRRLAQVKAQDERRNKTLAILIRALIALLLAAFLAVLASQGSGQFSANGVLVLILLASASTGGFFGFLFAVPRVLAHDDGAVQIDDGEGGPPAITTPARTRMRFLSSNTNLERISDWLTTMLVGVGLTQLTNVPKLLDGFRQYLAENVKVYPSPNLAEPSPITGIVPALGPILLVFGAVLGFITAYLYTRLWLTALFNAVEDELVNGPYYGELLGGDEAVAAVREKASELSTATQSPSIWIASTNAQVTVQDSLNVMFNYLYQDGKFQDVIDLGQKLASTAAARKPEYWFYLAAAFGQKLTDAIAKERPESELEDIKRSIRDCAMRTIRLDPGFKHSIKLLTDPSRTDNDLQDMRNDKQFMDLVKS
jgi:hypothetical protein